MQAFPIPAPRFTGGSRRVDAGSAWNWLTQGWAMFIAHPGTWMAMMVILIVIYLALAIVPLVGQLAAHVLTPVLAGGMLIACQKVADEQTPAIADLFAGFQRSTGALATLGVLYMLGMLAVFLVIVLLAGGGLAGGMMIDQSLAAGIAVGSLLLAMLLGLLLTVPLLMAIWFAPALVIFNGMQPVDALKASFNACLKNVLVFTVYGLFTMVLCFFAALPVGLGFLVLGPVLAGSVYASYKDIFLAT